MERKKKKEEKRHLCTRLQSVKEDQGMAWHGPAPSLQLDLCPMVLSAAGQHHAWAVGPASG